MIQQIAHLITISAYCLAWGIPVMVIALRDPVFRRYWAPTPVAKLSLTFFSGLISLSVISSWAALFVPLHFGTLQAVTLLPLFFCWRKRHELKYWQESLRQLTLKRWPLLILAYTACAFLVFILLGTLHPVNPDTLIYHVQIIRWTNEYGIVPGIANLFPRYGLGSSWFNLVSLFKSPLMSSANYTWLNTAAVCWFFLWLVDKWRYSGSHENRDNSHRIQGHFYFWALLYALFEWEIMRDAANSTNYDFIVTALTFMLLSELAGTLLRNERVEGTCWWAMMLTLVTLVTFKLSGIFLLLVLSAYLLRWIKRKNAAPLAIAGLAILVPILIKNHIITGYPLFPLTFSFFHPDWQLPQEMTAYLRDYIFVTNRFYNHQIDYTKIPELAGTDWFLTWTKGLLLRQKIILSLCALALPILLWPSSRNYAGKRILVLFSIITLMASGWLLTAPSPRFGYGMFLILGIFPLSYRIGKYIPLSYQQIVVGLAVAIGLIYLGHKGRILLSRPGLIWEPMALNKPAIREVMINGKNYNFPDIIPGNWMHDCYDAPLPCISQPNPYLDTRGPSLSHGFRMREIPDSQFIRQYTY